MGPKIFYGQKLEDKVAYQFLQKFPETELRRTYLDVGAYDGVHLSNSRLFEELGWQGICVEANPQAFEALRKNRSCICLNVACSDRTAEIEFFAQPGRPMGTTNVEAINSLKKTWHFKPGERSVVPAKTVDEILRENGLPQIDFASIDVDGAEISVLKGFDLRRANVKLLCIETNLKQVRRGRWPRERVLEIDRLITEQGYKLMKIRGANSFYADISTPLKTRLHWLLALHWPFRRTQREETGNGAADLHCEIASNAL